MEIKRAGEIMIPLEEYPHIPYWYTLRQAAEEMDKLEIDTKRSKYHPRVVLVFDADRQLVGMLRRQDILRGLATESLVAKILGYRRKILSGETSADQMERSSQKLLKSMREGAERPVSDVMLPIKAPVHYEDSVVKAIYEMIDQNVILLAVLKEEKVVGVVEILELFHEVTRMIAD
jgi:CBS domain-containing protein